MGPWGENLEKSTTITIPDFKPCGNFKARLVIDAYLTKEPTKIVHSGAISLKIFKLAMFTAEPINFQLWGADDENAYFQALTKEKLCIVTVPEIEKLQEHVLVMYKTLYDKTSGGTCSYDNVFGILQPMNFHSSGRKAQVSSVPRQRGVTEFSN